MVGNRNRIEIIRETRALLVWLDEQGLSGKLAEILDDLWYEYVSIGFSSIENVHQKVLNFIEKNNINHKIKN